MFFSLSSLSLSLSLFLSLSLSLSLSFSLSLSSSLSLCACVCLSVTVFVARRLDLVAWYQVRLLSFTTIQESNTSQHHPFPELDHMDATESHFGLKTSKLMNGFTQIILKVSRCTLALGTPDIVDEE